MKKGKKANPRAGRRWAALFLLLVLAGGGAAVRPCSRSVQYFLPLRLKNKGKPNRPVEKSSLFCFSKKHSVKK